MDPVTLGMAKAFARLNFRPKTYRCALPTGLGWDVSAYPLEPIVLSVRPDGSVSGSCALSAKSAFDAVSTARTAPGTELWVDPSGGNDSNSGTQASPYLTIAKAVQVANAAGLPAKVRVLRTLPRVSRGKNPSNGGATTPTVDIAFIAHGRINTGTYDDISALNPPTPDATYTSCYTLTVATAGSVDKVLDVTNVVRGNYAELTYVPTRALCNATPGSWFIGMNKTVAIGITSGSPNITAAQVVFTAEDVGKTITGTGIPASTTISSIGSDCKSAVLSANATATNTTLSATVAAATTTLYIHRADGQPVTVNNTRYYRPSHVFRFTSHVNIYIGGNNPGDGWDCEGGTIGVIDSSALGGSLASDKVLAVENSSFKYGGGIASQLAGAPGRGVSIDNWRGLALFENCHASACDTDLFNWHNGASNSRVHILTINCTGFDTGRPGQPSNNGHTLHENVKGVDIAGQLEDTRGGTVRNIHTSKAYYAGTRTTNDMGDITLGSAAAGIPPTGFRADDSAEVWCEYTDVRGPAGMVAYSTGAAGAKLHKRNVQPTPLADYSAVGTIDSNW